MDQSTITSGFEPNVRWDPFIKDGMAGFKVTRLENGSVTYVYMNPSSGGEGAPDVFVYSGAACDPADDDSVCYINPVFEV